MPDSRKSKAQLQVEDYLKEVNFTPISSDNSGELAMRGKIVANDEIVDTVIVLDKNYPASYPKFYTVDNKDVFSKPHIGLPRIYNGLPVNEMCYITEREKLYNPNPVDLMYRCVDKFEGLCRGLSNGEFDNRVEILNEFDSYWERGIVDLFLYTKEDISNNGFLTLMDLRSINNVSGTERQLGIITDSPEEVERFASIAGFTVNGKSLCPYIDIGDKFNLPVPRTYAEFGSLIKRSGHEKFIKKASSKAGVGSVFLFSFLLPNGKRHYAGLVHKLQVISNGMRKQLNYNSFFFNRFYGGKPLTGIHLKSIKRDWLMERGGNITMSKYAKSSKQVAIVGCGSIGSNLAYKLCKSGIGNMTLIDNSSLKNSNIGRHFLGMRYIHQNKAEAMKHELMSQFVGVDVEAVAEMSQNAIEKLQSADLLVVAIGSDDPCAESQIAALSRKGELPPSIFCWLEAQGVAGHALYIDKESLISMEVMSEQMELLEESFAESLVAHEVGCNSEYMPYAHLDADEHINHMTRYVLQVLHKENYPKAKSSFSSSDTYMEYYRYKIPDNKTLSWDAESFIV